MGTSHNNGSGVRLKAVSVKVTPHVRQRLRMYAVRLNSTISEAFASLVLGAIDEDGFTKELEPTAGSSRLSDEFIAVSEVSE